MVENPKTSELVNVEPIINLINLISESKMHVIGGELDLAIRFIALSDWSEVALNKVDILRALFEIRDAFNNASETIN
jgi:predicted component of type VI protein secretion system